MTKTEMFYRDGAKAGMVPDSVITKGAAFLPRQVPCNRCGGAGGSEKWRHTGWTCYDCGGAAFFVRSTRVYTAEKLAQLNEAQTKRDAKRAAEAEVRRVEREAEAEGRRAAFIDANRQLVADLMNEVANDGFLAEMSATLDRKGALTFAQAATVQNIVARIRAERERRSRLHHIGEVGDRVTLTLTAVKWIQTSRHPVYGPSFLVIMRTDDGQEVVYFGSGGGDVPAEGETLTVKATVKEHRSYDGRPQTVVIRIKEVK